MARLTAERLWSIPRLGTPTPAGTGAAVVPVTTHDLEENRGTTRLWMVRRDGSRRPLTRADVDATAPSVSTDGASLAFLRRDGEGRRQVHVMPLTGGEPEPVTDLPLGALGAKWLPDGSGLVVLAYLLRGHLTVEETADESQRRAADKVTARATEDAVFRYWDTWLTGGEVPHLFHLDLGTGTCRDLIPESDRWWRWPNTENPLADFDVAPDGAEVAFCADRSTPPHGDLRWSLFTVPLSQPGAERCLTPDLDGQARRPRYSPDGRHLVYGMQRIADFYADRVRLVALDRRRGEHVVLTEAWDASAESWEFAGADLVLTAEERGRTHLWRMPVAETRPRRVAAGGTVGDPAVGADGTVLALIHDLSHPPEVGVVSGEGITAITDFTAEATSDLDLGEVEEVTLTGGGDDPVQMFIVHPPGFDAARPWPLVHMIHGGPHATFADAWHWRWNAQAFAAPGHVVALVNFHGSTSFGEAFTTSIQGTWGELPYADVEAATDHLVATGYVDPDRMAVTGGSYGGYLTAWIVSQTDRYACAVAHAAVTDLPGMYASDVTMGRSRAYGADIWIDRERVERWSPLAHSGGFSTPTLVIHGECDYRVPVGQGLQLYGVLKAKGVEARLLYYPDENHWILTPANSIRWHEEVLGWLHRHLA